MFEIIRWGRQTLRGMRRMAARAAEIAPTGMETAVGLFRLGAMTNLGFQMAKLVVALATVHIGVV